MEGGRQFLNQYFSLINTLHVSDLLKSAQELKRTDIFLFKNTNAPQSAPASIRKLDMNFVDFQMDHMILRKMSKAQMKQRGSQLELQQFVYT